MLILLAYGSVTSALLVLLLVVMAVQRVNSWFDGRRQSAWPKVERRDPSRQRMAWSGPERRHPA